jgi:hypothetical protein
MPVSNSYLICPHCKTCIDCKKSFDYEVDITIKYKTKKCR